MLRCLSGGHLLSKPLRDRPVGVDAAVAQKGPVAANLLLQLHVHGAQQDLFLVVRRLGQDAAKGIGQERAAPEIKSRARHLVAANVARLVAHAIDGADKNSVGNGVRPLDGEPGIVLCRAPLLLFRRMPANGGGVEDDVRARKGG